MLGICMSDTVEKKTKVNPVPMFSKGGTGGPGRPKNSLNRNRLVGDVLKRLDFDPLEEVIHLFRDEETPPKVRADIALKVMRLVYPEVKQIHVESHSVANAMNPIAEAMLQIEERKSGFDYKNGNAKERNKPSTPN
jgi:hypothetical protein